MAKNFNSVSFTLLLVVLVMASTGFLVTTAQTPCPATTGENCIYGGCVPGKVFAEECGPAPFVDSSGKLMTHCDCCKCCKATYPNMVTCYAAVEGSDKHCHCYKKT